MKKILLVVSGSVAISKVLNLVNLLKSYDVKVIATDYAKNNFSKIKQLNLEKEDYNLEIKEEARHIFLAK